MIYLCPVCNGRGQVPAGFYLDMPVGTSASPEGCRACSGKGYITSKDLEPTFTLEPRPSDQF